jgi:DNA modification methylase
MTRIEAAKELAKRRNAAGDNAEIRDPLQYFRDKIILGDCVEKLKELPNNICDLFITDPPFGVDFDKLLDSRTEYMQTGKHQGTYKDDPDTILSLTENVVNEMSRVGKKDCVVIMFCGSQHWHPIKKMFEAAGFSVHNKPLIWVKASTDPFRLMSGRTPNPEFAPSNAYEPMVYARRGQVVMAKQGLPDVFVHQTLSTVNRFHIAQKPIPLLEEIISRFYHPSTNPVLIDPFVGSGSTIWAAFRLGIRVCFGYEIDPEFRERAVAFLVNEYMKKEEGKGDPVTIDLDLDLDEDF